MVNLGAFGSRLASAGRFGARAVESLGSFGGRVSHIANKGLDIIGKVAPGVQAHPYFQGARALANGVGGVANALQTAAAPFTGRGSGGSGPSVNVMPDGVKRQAITNKATFEKA